MVCGWVCADNYVVAVYHAYGRNKTRVAAVPSWWAEQADQDQKEAFIMGVVKKVAAASGEPPRGEPSKISGLGAGTDGVWEFLTLSRYPDGSKRERSTLTVFYGDQGLTCVLNDRDNERALFASGESLGAILELMEDMVGSDNTVWRADKLKTGSSARKKS